ncbi:hypothetical protein BD410DRAFT_808449 [Rickenella mellea]|uniref:Uncharacterized protein n=1 Tax=Rickenella mellea TaxID=50990 RepID=A0A4Y7PN40_9AGAM|nr:hypothetical protein BD410DRAFT_808449 [Rickenella mellea]
MCERRDMSMDFPITSVGTVIFNQSVRQYSPQTPTSVELCIAAISARHVRGFDASKGRAVCSTDPPDSPAAKGGYGHATWSSNHAPRSHSLATSYPIWRRHPNFVTVDEGVLTCREVAPYIRLTRRILTYGPSRPVVACISSSWCYRLSLRGTGQCRDSFEDVVVTVSSGGSAWRERQTAGLRNLRTFVIGEFGGP